MRHCSRNMLNCVSAVSEKWKTMFDEKTVVGIACIVADVDGTLLNNKKQITGATVAAIRMAQQRGIPLTYATGRHPLLIRDIIRAVGIEPELPVIGCNGAIITNYAQDFGIDCLPAQSAARCLDIARRFGADRYVFLPEKVVVSAQVPRAHLFAQWGMDIFEKGILEISRDADMIRIQGNIIKLLIFDEDDEKLERIRRLVAEDEALWAVLSEKGNLDVTGRGVSKGQGVQRLSAITGIPLSSIMALGDGENDWEMLRLCGLGVAMGNAHEAARSAADWITKTNDEDGAAWAIQALCAYRTR